ncbi:MAG: ABC transporter [Gammaproteobacteria bacterium]|nr:MAG: ABC transporter [Gammaproteobacteria bacterium]
MNSYEPANRIAVIENLSKYFKDTKALGNINLCIKSGQVTSILGPNGAGKTTLINILLGRLSASEGHVEIFSRAPGDIVVKRKCGAMLQVSSLPDTLTIKEHLELFQSYYSNPMDYQTLIELADLVDIEHRFSKNLSGGQKQKLLFALAICGNPKLLFLDEPSVGLDVKARKNLWKAINRLKQQGTGIVLTTHYLEEADHLSDHIVMLNNGQIIQEGTPEEIKQAVNFKKIIFKSSLPLSALSELEATTEVAKSGTYFEIKTTNTAASMKIIFDLVEDISELTITAAALEDAFIQLNEPSTTNNLAA